jgi:hypothetical protein
VVLADAGDGSEITGADADLLVIAGEANLLTLCDFPGFLYESPAFARLGAELGRVVGDLFARGVELNRKDVAARLRGYDRGLTVVGDAIKAGAAAFVVDLVSGS